MISPVNILRFSKINESISCNKQEILAGNHTPSQLIKYRPTRGGGVTQEKQSMTWSTIAKCCFFTYKLALLRHYMLAADL